MKTLALIPKTNQERRQHAIAIVLDNAFISNRDGSHKLNTFIAKDFDELVEKIERAVSRHIVE